MTRAPVLLLLLSLSLAPLALAGEGDPSGDPCKNNREHPCTDVLAGEMECMPAAGKANDLAIVVGSADSGTFKLEATGTNHPDSNTGCLFEIRVLGDEATFDAGWAPGLLGSPGAITSWSSQACFTMPGEECTATATFTWWRAVHGVMFDVPYELVVNGEVVARGKAHYYDPPMMESVTGGPVAV